MFLVDVISRRTTTTSKPGIRLVDRGFKFVLLAGDVGCFYFGEDKEASRRRHRLQKLQRLESLL